jgi:hypothetical protein
MKKDNLLIVKTLLLILFLGLTSCSNDNDENNADLNAKYIHLIENCDNTSNPEINCTEFVEFNESGIVNVLIGGGDIVYQTDYSINESKVEFEKSSGLNFDISFTIIDDKTLKRNEDGEIWTKDN